jgi:hypothetical protein
LAVPSAEQPNIQASFISRVRSYAVSWSRRFDDPIKLPKGKPLVTLKDAASYILTLPKSKQQSPEWQTAAEVLLMAAEDRGPLMHAHIGMLKALNHGKPNPATTPARKRAKAYWIVR